MEPGQTALQNHTFRTVKVGGYNVVLEYIVTAFATDSFFKDRFYKLVHIFPRAEFFPSHKNFLYVEDRDRLMVLAYHRCDAFDLPEGFRWAPCSSFHYLPALSVLLAVDTSDLLEEIL